LLINIGLLSAAHIHTRGFLEDISKRDDCELALVWDDMPERGNRYAIEYGAEYQQDLEKAVSHSDVDAFIICAENTRHLPLLRASIPTGKAVFCEKPFTTSRSDAEEVLGLASKYSSILHMGYFQPFDGMMQGVKSVIDEGLLGKITHANFRNAHHAAYGRWFDSDDLSWFSNPSLAGGGAFMDMGAHAIHLLRSFLGPVSKVSAVIGNSSGIYSEVDDNGVAIFHFDSGIIATVQGSWVQTGGMGGLEITGSDGTLFNHPDQGYVIASPGKEMVSVQPQDSRPTRVDRLIAAINGELSNQELGEDLINSADSVAIMEACYSSSESGKWEKVTSFNAPS
jgi:predicted dehydrogenase